MVINGDAGDGSAILGACVCVQCHNSLLMVFAYVCIVFR